MKNLIYFEISDGKIKSLECGPSMQISNSENEVVITYKDLPSSTEKSEFLNAILICLNGNESKVYVDHYSSIPLFYTQINDRIIFSNIFDRVANQKDSILIDKIGFWESFLFETPFLERTIIQDISTIQAGCYLSITNNVLLQKQYFNFDFEKSNKNDYLFESFECLKNNIDFDFENKEILFPLSGGIDSRLLLSLFKTKKIDTNIHPITYGFSKSSLEFKYARKLLKSLRISYLKHDFHKLDSNAYLNSINDSITISGGLIGCQNSHFFSYIKSKLLPTNIVSISGFFADSIFGYASSTTFTNQKTNKYYKIALRFYEKEIIDFETLNGISKDLEILFAIWEKDSNIDSFSEFLYLRERTTKFHMHLYNMYRTKIDVLMPLYQKDIIKYFMGLPSNIKVNKNIIFELLENYYPEISSINNISSSGRFGSGKGHGMTKSNYLLYLLITGVNKTLINFLHLPIYINNPYDTEKQEYFFLKKFKKSFISDLDYLESNKIVTNMQSNILSKRVDAMRNMQLLTNTHLLKKYMK